MQKETGKVLRVVTRRYTASELAEHGIREEPVEETREEPQKAAEVPKKAVEEATDDAGPGIATETNEVDVSNSVERVRKAVRQIQAATGRELAGSKVSFTKADQVSVRDACMEVLDTVLALMSALRETEETCRRLKGRKSTSRDQRKPVNAVVEKAPEPPKPKKKRTKKASKARREQATQESSVANGTAKAGTNEGASTSGSAIVSKSSPARETPAEEAPTGSYAEAAAKRREPRKPKVTPWETLVRVEGRTAAEATTDISSFLRECEEIRPLEGVVPTKRGVVVLKAENKAQKEVLERKIRERAEGPSRWTIEEPGVRKHGDPPVVICGLEQAVRAEEVIRDLFAENPEVRGELSMGEWTGSVRFLARKPRFGGRVDLVFTAAPAIHAKMVTAGRVSVGKVWRRIAVRYDVVRCFKCSKFGHRQSRCGGKECCARCGGAHGLRECRDEGMDCPNCRRAGRSERRHKATSSACPEYQRMVREKMERFAKPPQQG